jgi:hypothetical protein
MLELGHRCGSAMQSRAFRGAKCAALTCRPSPAKSTISPISKPYHRYSTAAARRPWAPSLARCAPGTVSVLARRFASRLAQARQQCGGSGRHEQV